MLASAATFTLGVTLVKYLGEGYPAPLQTFYRQSAGLLILAVPILRGGASVLRTSRPVLLTVRSLLGVVAMNLGFFAYQHLSLADANALSFTRILWIVPIAALFLRERPGGARLVATLVGFCGVLIMLGPSGSTSSDLPAVAAALLAALLLALTIVGMKSMTRDHTTLGLLGWSAILGFALSVPGAFLTWRTPDLRDALLLLTMGALGVITQAFYIRGIRLADATSLAPIDYTRLIFAVALGYFLFSELPSAATLLGAAVVVGSTLYITWREATGRRVRNVEPPDLPVG